MDVKMLKILTYLIIMMPVASLAQVFDDFSDGDFVENPAWFGTDALFKVNSDGQLQLDANEAGSAWLFCDADVATNVIDGNFEWHFWLKEAFSPSSKNYCDVYLCDKYFIRFGEAGSNDVVDLQRVDGTTSVSVCRGTDTFIATSFSAFFKVVRDADGIWKIFVDKTGSGEYVAEAQGVDNVFEPTGNFGIKTTFTASNAKKVYLDDVYAGPLFVDTESPQLDTVIILKYNKLQLEFSEPVDAVFALDAENYSLDNGVGKPMYAEYNGDNHASLILSFSKTIEEGVYYALKINKIQDVAGNISENIHYTFINYEVHENDVVINEIMADPVPSIGLPDCEYIELYNTTNHKINLKDWVIIIGNSEKQITQDIDIQSYNYLILCKEDTLPYLLEYGDCVGFPSFSIPNTGAFISLMFHGNLISEIDFDNTWYRDNEKSEGGWSLEQIDPHSPCLYADNWCASCSHLGGTPCAKNSVYEELSVPPDIDYVNVLSSNTLELVFNQKMDAVSLADTSNYTILEMDSHPYSAMPSQDCKSVTLFFQLDFQFHNHYKVLVFSSTNCSGIPVLDECCHAFGMPEEAVGGDVVINEILFDPISPAADYVEIFNKSDKVLNINKLQIGVIKTSFPNPPDTTIKEICQEGRQLMPQGYLLLTTTPELIASQYECKTDNFIKMKSFPSYPNSGATAVLLYDGKIIDIMQYSKDLHYPLLVETKGVALERVSPDVCSSDTKNWQSAAAPLYGTPGYKNSVFIENAGGDDIINVLPTVFSPDNDGFDDVTTIQLTTPCVDCSIKILVLNSSGGFIKNVISGQNIGHQSLFVWDGKDENGHIVPAGIYVLYIELFDLQGDIKRFKKAVVVASK